MNNIRMILPSAWRMGRYTEGFNRSLERLETSEAPINFADGRRKDFIHDRDVARAKALSFRANIFDEVFAGGMETSSARVVQQPARRVRFIVLHQERDIAS